MGVLNPWGLLFASLIGPIIWVYLWREKKQVIWVSSIIPWRKLLIDKSSNKQRFGIDRQLILQILVIVFITFALARFYYLQKISTENQVLVIDTSASMSALDKNGVTRLENAKTKALDIINKMKVPTHLSIIEMAGTSVRLNGFTDKKTELIKLIEGLKQKEEETDFPAALNLAHSVLAKYEGSKIYWISDNDEFVLKGQYKNQNLEVVKIGQDLDNVAITGLDSYQGLFSAKKQTIYIRIANYGRKEETFNLNVFLDDKLVKQKRITLFTDSHQNFPLEVQGATGVLKVELDIEDALSLDNRAYLLLEEKEKFPVLLVTPSDDMEIDFSRLVHATGRIDYRRIHPNEFDPTVLKFYQVVIFHLSAPTQLLPINSIFIAPPSGHGLWEVQQNQVTNTQICDWDRHHSVLKYLDFLDKINIDSAQNVRIPSWGNLLMGTSELPLAFWGEEKGYKQLVFCFDLQPLLFPTSQDVSGIILMLNCLDWLSYSDKNIRAGDPYVLKSSQPLKEVVVTNPKGEKVIFAPKEKIFHYNQTHYIGVYKVKTEDVTGVRREYSFVANLLNESEAELTTPKTERRIQEKAKKNSLVKDKNRTPLELWRCLLIIAIICILGEWWLYFKESI